MEQHASISAMEEADQAFLLTEKSSSLVWDGKTVACTGMRARADMAVSPTFGAFPSSSGISRVAVLLATFTAAGVTTLPVAGDEVTVDGKKRRVLDVENTGVRVLFSLDWV